MFTTFDRDGCSLKENFPFEIPARGKKMMANLLEN